MYTILTVNTGSSSVRLSLVALDGNTVETLGAHHQDNHLSDRTATIARFLGQHPSHRPAAVGHRLVHGGTRFVQPVVLDRSVAQALTELAPLAPLHMPEALAWTRAAGDVVGPAVPQVCVFDTAYFADLPTVASTYAIPADLAARHGIRRFGFHGLAHKALWRRWSQLRPDLPGGGRLVTLQLGSGCSAAAIRGVSPLDTSMGFTPIEGLVMATRSGDLDPGVLLALQRLEAFDTEKLQQLLDRHSGLKGVSGSTGDMRELLRRRDDPAARLAVELFCYRVRKYVGAYFAVLGGADGIVFGGGIGENGPEVRALSLSNLDALGIVLDEDANRRLVGQEGRIASPRGKVDVRVLVADEAGEIAREAAGALGQIEKNRRTE